MSGRADGADVQTSMNAARAETVKAAGKRAAIRRSGGANDMKKEAANGTEKINAAAADTRPTNARRAAKTGAESRAAILRNHRMGIMKGVRLGKNERVDSLDHLGRRIIQRADGFRFAMDAVLLAHFPRYRQKCRVLDLGTGGGAMPLLIAEHASYIEAVELDKAAAGMAARSVLLNGLEKTIRVRRADYCDLQTLAPPERFDVALANPPYGNLSDGPIAKGARAGARQETTAMLLDVVRAARYALRYHGKFAMVYRPARLADVFAAFSACQLVPKRMRFVEPRAGKSANLVLIEAVQGGAPGGLIALPTLRVYDGNGNYTPELLEIYGKH